MASASLPPTAGAGLAGKSPPYQTMMPDGMPAPGGAFGGSAPSPVFRTTLPDSMPFGQSGPSGPGSGRSFPANPMSSMSPGGGGGPCASFPSQGPSASFGSRGPPSPGMGSRGPCGSMGPQPPPFQTMPPTAGPMASGSPFGSLAPSAMSSMPPGADDVLGRECLVVVSKLLDVPVDKGIFGAGAKTYFLRVLDHKNKELACSDDIQGMDDFNLGAAPSQTFAIPEDLGSIRAKTTSRTIHIEVAFSGVIGGTTIGACQINRLDPRSKQAWPYEICKDGEVICGIELRVLEDPDSRTQVAYASQGVQGSMMASQGGQKKAIGSQYLTDNELEDVHHGVSCMLELHGAKDLPAPRTANMKDVVVTVLTDAGRQLRKIGLFESQEQIGRQLASVDLQHTRTFVQAPLHFGGDAQEGAQYIKVTLSYGKRSGTSTTTEVIGATDPIKVSWKPVVKQYQEIRNPENRAVLGGLYLSHRLVTEAESLGQQTNEDAVKLRRQPQMGPPMEIEHRVSGRTGNFPAGSPEEAMEQAVINAEAQNRALLQRCKKEDPRSSDDFPGMRMVNGWREWDSLDDVFQSMGPNPLVLSEELGPQVSRGYQHNRSVARDVAKHLPGAKSPADQMLNLEMLRMFHKDDPSKMDSLVRPVICKDPNEIAQTGHMVWCPDPPVYVPVGNMTEQDKETLRLACYRPEQTANLLFVDANPNYNIKQDIWGALEEKSQSRLLNGLRPHARVKDDCLMA